MWLCKNCGEKVGENFDACWSCRGDRDGAPTEPEPSKEDETEDLDRSDDAPRVRDQNDAQKSSRNPVEVAYKSTPLLLIIGLILMALSIVGTAVARHRGMHFMPLFWLGTLLLIIYGIQRHQRTLGKYQIVEKYPTTMIPGGRGLGEELMRDTEQRIVQTEAPDIHMEYEIITATLFPWFKNGRQQCLVISNIANPHLKSYKMYLNVRDYGVHLLVSWYVAYQPNLFQRVINLLTRVPIIGLLLMPLRSSIYKQGGSLGLDIFDEQELAAYVDNAHECFKAAMKDLGKEHSVDTSKINRQPTGFLGIS